MNERLRDVPFPRSQAKVDEQGTRQPYQNR